MTAHFMGIRWHARLLCSVLFLFLTIAVTANAEEKYVIDLGDHELKAEVLVDTDEALLKIRLLDKSGQKLIVSDRDFILVNLTVKAGSARQYRLPKVAEESAQNSVFSIQHRVLVSALQRHDGSAVMRVFVNGRGYAGKLVDPNHHNDHGHEH